MFNTSILLGFSFVLAFVFVGYWLFKKIGVVVEDETESFILSFGEVKRKLQKPGLHLIYENFYPWVEIINISKQIDYRTYQNIQVNDHFGTTVIIDLWIEFKISDPYKAIFEVENWEEVLKSSVMHTTTAILSAQTIQQILSQRAELGMQLKEAMLIETERWGITLSAAMIQNVSLLPEVSKQFFGTVAAKIERTKALIQEEGRLKVARLDAETAHRFAELNALAKVQMPKAISEAYKELAKDPKVLRAFQEYWELLHLDPRKTVAFNKLPEGSIGVLEASMAVESYLNH
jgi:regulator of protease activity HflC (stomatin/prohibitin superfamily)